jgi:hypothetical protein
MHRSHTPLRKWFWAIFLASHDKRGIAAQRLADEIGVSYPTAWLMLQKIRKAMGDRDARYQLAGIVEVDDTYFGGPKHGGKRGRGTGKTKVIVAVSLNDQGKPGYVKIAVSDDLTDKSLVEFAEKNRRAGATVSSDTYRSYLKAFSEGIYAHDPKKFDAKGDKNRLKWLHTIVSNAKTFILGTYHRLDATHFQAYLDEFCFRMNRRFFAFQLFEALFEGLLLWLFIWLWRNRKPFKGFLLSLYLGGYGIIRFFIEYFREPDSDLGYRIQLIPTTLPPAQAHPALCFSTGQIFSFCMVLIAVAWFFIARKLPNNEPVRVYPDTPAASSGPTAQEREEARKSRRKLRKKLR